MDSFEFQLEAKVRINISGECGEIRGRAQYSNLNNQYQIAYKAADGRAVEAWFFEAELKLTLSQR